MAAVPNAFVHPASILALEVFRLNGILVAVGDTLVAPLGLTSARWQVMGAIAEAKGMLPVAGIARNMGLVRQSVQRIADELAQLCQSAFNSFQVTASKSFHLVSPISAVSCAV
jgi:hypothetical protein